MNNYVFLALLILVYLFVGIVAFFILKIIFSVKGHDDYESFDNAILISFGWPFIITIAIVGAPFWCVNKAADVVIKLLKKQKGVKHR